MSRGCAIENLSDYPDPEVRDLVEFGMGEVETAGVLVTVKNARSCIYRGRVYRGAPGALYRVTMEIGSPEEFPADNLRTREEVRRGVPLDDLLRQGRRPYGGRRSPVVELADWRECLVFLAGQEGWHIHQFRRQLRRSEAEAERHGAWRLLAYRKEVGRWGRASGS